jgi:hypothetical protein
MLQTRSNFEPVKCVIVHVVVKVSDAIVIVDVIAVDVFVVVVVVRVFLTNLLTFI